MPASCIPGFLFQGLACAGLQSLIPHKMVPNIPPFFVCYGRYGGTSDEACYLLFAYTISGKQFVYTSQGTKDYND